MGSNGGCWVVLGRAGDWVPCGRAACCFVLAKSTENVEKRMRAMQREQRAMLEVQRFERIVALGQRIFEYAFAVFDQVERELGAPVKVKAIPAASETGEATKAAKTAMPKRTIAKPITAEFQVLEPVRPQKARRAGMGNEPFDASAKVPSGAAAQLPGALPLLPDAQRATLSKQRLSA